MSLAKLKPEPDQNHYDVVVIGGAMIGSSVAWFLSHNNDFKGRILVVERDPTYQFSSTAATTSSIRHQFSNPLNIQISKFGTEFIRRFKSYVGPDDNDVPDIDLHEFGYLFLANKKNAHILVENQKTQAQYGAATRLLTPDQIASEFPFFNLDDVCLGSHNPVGEGWFDGNTMMYQWRRKSRESGVEYITNEVASINRDSNRVNSIGLATGETIACDTIVNASGPRAAQTAAMAGLKLPVEPRKRSTFVFDSRTPLAGILPLTIDSSGVYCTRDGAYFRTAAAPVKDMAVAYDDFDVDYEVFNEIIWPALAHRIPAFEAIKVTNAWAGHYAYNVLDQNAVIGPHPELGNFIFVNGFSGHGLQQAPAMGRGVSELVTYGEFRALDLSPLGYERILSGKPFIETAII